MIICLSNFSDDSSKLQTKRVQEYIWLYNEVDFHTFDKENPYQGKIDTLNVHLTKIHL